MAVAWKKLSVDQIDLILLQFQTLAQIKVWLYHYRREGGGDERKSFSSQDTVCQATGLGRSAVSHARTWLVRNGWLRVIGYRPLQRGEWAVREYICCFPTDLGTTKPEPRLPDAYDLGIVEPTTQAPQSLEPRLHNAAEVDNMEVDSPARPPEVDKVKNQVSERVSEDARAASPPSLPSGSGESKEKSKPIDHDDEAWKDRQWLSAEDLYHELFPSKPITDPQTQMLIDLAEEVGELRGITYGGMRLENAWKWNQARKKGKYKLYGLEGLARAVRSTNERNIFAQMDADEDWEQDKPQPQPMLLPPVAPAPPEPLTPQQEWNMANREQPRCRHGQVVGGDCEECTYPKNAECLKCKERFHQPNPQRVKTRIQFCSQGCEDAFNARERELAAKYAKPKPEDDLAGFLGKTIQ